MPTLLPDDDIALSWFPKEADKAHALTLLNWVNQRAAKALAHPTSLHWLGQVAGSIHGLIVFVLDQPWVTLMFRVPQDRPDTSLCGLASKGAVVEWHSQLTLMSSQRLSSGAELIEHVFSDDWHGPSYVDWAKAVIKACLQEHRPLRPTGTLADVHPGLARLLNEACRAMERALPVATLHQLLKRRIVGDDNLVRLLECIGKHGLLQDKYLIRRLLDDHINASRLWGVVVDSHERLAPVLLAALPHLSPIQTKASVLTQQLGLGKHLSQGLRQLRADQIGKLLEATEGCRDIRLVQSFFRQLGRAWARFDNLYAGESRFAGQRIECLFALCMRFAQIDRWADRGWQGLPQPSIFAICPYIPNGPQLAPDDARYADQPLIPLDDLRHVLQAVLSALIKSSRSDDLDTIIGDLDHVMDWLSTTPSTDTGIPAGISLQRLYERADDWVATEQMASIPELAWPCALIDANETWQALADAITRDYRVVALVNTASLIDESRHMKHCVAPVYWLDAARGVTRLFSIEHQGGRFATLELTYVQAWRCLQMKGQRNLELMPHLESSDSPLGRLCRALVEFYNQWQPSPYRSVLDTKRSTPAEPCDDDIPAFLRYVEPDYQANRSIPERITT